MTLPAPTTEISPSLNELVAHVTKNDSTNSSSYMTSNQCR